MTAKSTRKLRLPSTVNRPRGAKSGLSAKAREVLERTRKAIAERVKP